MPQVAEGIVFMGASRNQPTNQSIKELTEGGDLCENASRRPSICLVIPALPYRWAY